MTTFLYRTLATVAAGALVALAVAGAYVRIWLRDYSRLAVLRRWPISERSRSLRPQPVSARGTAGSILSGRWGRTRIDLTPGGSQFIQFQRGRMTAAVTIPTTLRAGGPQSTVPYLTVSTGWSYSSRASSVRAAYLRH